MTPKYVSAFLCAFVGGIAVASIYEISFTHFYFHFLFVLVITSLILLWRKFVGAMLLCMVFGLTFGVWYSNASFKPNEYNTYIGSKIDMEGVIVEDPQLSVSSFNGHTSLQLVILPDGFSQYIRAQLYTPIPDAHNGDRVWLRGEVQMPESFSGFDYVGYLQRWQIYAVLKKPKVIVLHRSYFSVVEPQNWPITWRAPLISLRRYLKKQSLVFPNKEGSIIIGMLIGQKQNIPKDVLTAFQRTGLTHIVAVSGFNMTVIATACGALVYYLGRRATNLLTVVVVVMFVVVTGATAAVVRAAIMALLMIVAQLLGRRYASLYSLLIVSVIMILQNPRVLVWDVGFQLSVSATLGVLLAFQVKDPESKQVFLENELRPTIGAILFTWPIIAYNFETFSVIAIAANILVLPFVTWIMLFGALSLIPIIGNAFVYPAQLLTSAILFITEKFSSIPFASVELIFPIYVYVFYYIILILYVFFRLQRLKNHGKL